MKVHEIMTAELEMIRPDSSIFEAAAKMRGLGTGILPVCDGDRLIGILTERDLTFRAFAYGHDPAHTRVQDVMTRNVTPCFDDEPAEEVSRRMQDYQVRGWPVVNRRKRLVGIVRARM